MSDLPILGCNGSRYRAVARNNFPGSPSGSEDVFKSAWFSTPQLALSDLETGPNRWMRWSFALLIERCDGHRMWAHSLTGDAA